MPLGLAHKLQFHIYSRRLPNVSYKDESALDQVITNMAKGNDASRPVSL